MTSTRHRIPRLGLTGGIGSGKSTALAYLHECGAAVVSSDHIVHAIYDRPAIIAAIQARYGQKVMTGANVNRQALGSLVFRDQAELQWLEQLLHPHVHAAVDEWAAAQDKSRPRPALIVAEVPLLFETGMDTSFDFVMLITAPAEIRRRRLSAKLTDEEFERRLALQMPEDEKVARSHFVFHNTGERKALREFVGQTVARILAGAEPPAGGDAREGKP
ncbi:MAG: dephospho-CoA kinase [Actinobacteria bacterium]|nr:dephospho-CoA kinase [Actinomycetota bacterium]